VSACARAGRNARLMSSAAREMLATLWDLHAAAAADRVGTDAYMIHCLAVACGRVGDAEGAIRVIDAGAGRGCCCLLARARACALVSSCPGLSVCAHTRRWDTCR
jgi:hypothetical protein